MNWPSACRPSWSWARRSPWRWNRTSPGPPSGRTQLSSQRVPQTRKRLQMMGESPPKMFSTHARREKKTKRGFQQEAPSLQEVIRPLREEMMISTSVTSLTAVLWWEDKLQDVARWISNAAKSSEIKNSINTFLWPENFNRKIQVLRGTKLHPMDVGHVAQPKSSLTGNTGAAPSRSARHIIPDISLAFSCPVAFCSNLTQWCVASHSCQA